MIFSRANVLVTGASSGLGLAVSKRFALAGANVVLLCRTERSGEEAVAQIGQDTPGASVRPMVCDLSSLASLGSFIADFTAENTTLDVLFNNAAVMKRERTVTEDGFEMMFQVNYLAPFILMNSLLGVVQASPIHMVLNNARPKDQVRLDFDDLQFEKRYRMWDSFFRTKLCLVLAALELAQRTEDTGTNIHMVVPGTFKSRLVREAPRPVGWVKNLFSSTVDAAAENILYVAQSAAARTGTGKVFTKRQEEPVPSYWRDPDVRSRLWTLTQSMIERTRA
jgi:NAD(P)-dependent dehydrogenase (short-subunit alcohol dehydrogenase family)